MPSPFRVDYYVRSREKGRGRGGEEERETKKQTHRVSPKKQKYNKTVATFSRHVCVRAHAKLCAPVNHKFTWG